MPKPYIPPSERGAAPAADSYTGVLQDEPTPTAEPSLRKELVATAGRSSIPAALVRLAGSFSPGGPVGAAMGAGGETIAELIENGSLDPRKLSPARIGIEAGIGAVPLGKIFKGARMAAAAKNTLMTGGAIEGRKWAEGQGVTNPLKDWNRGDYLNLVTGGAIGAAFGGTPKSAAAPSNEVGPHGPNPPNGQDLALRVATHSSEGKPDLTPYERGQVDKELLSEVGVDKSKRQVTQAVKSRTAYEKTKDEFNGVAQAGKNANAAEKFIGKEQVQDAKNEKARDKFVTDQLVQDTRNTNATAKFTEKATKVEAAAVKQAAAEEAITKAKAAGLEEQTPTVKKTLTAEVPGGRESVTTSFRQPEPEVEKTPPAGSAPKGPAPQSPISDLLKAAESLGLGKPKEAKPPVAPIVEAPAPKVAPKTPKVKAKNFKGQVDQLLSMLGPEEAKAPPAAPEEAPTPSAPIVEEAPAPERRLSPRTQEQVSQWLESKRASMAKPAEVPVVETPPEVAPPVSKVEAKPMLVKPGRNAPLEAKEAYRKANYNPEVNAKIDELASQYAAAPTDTPEGIVAKRSLGAQLQAWDKIGEQQFRESQAVQAGQVLASEKPVAPVVEGPPRPSEPTTTPTTDTLSQTSKAREAALAKRKALAAEKASTQAEVAPAQAELAELEKMDPVTRKEYIKKLLLGEEGSAPLALAMKMAAGGAGALTGYATDPFGDPLVSALVGGAAGLGGGHLLERGAGAGAGVMKAKIDDGLTKLFQKYPDYQRFSYLSNLTGLLANAVVGPWGSGVMGSIEHALQGDKRGLHALLDLANPVNFTKGFMLAKPHASEVIGRAEGTLKTNLKPGSIEWLMAQPGLNMTAGDIAVKDILMKNGFTAPEAERITLTSEPRWPTSKGLMNFSRARGEGDRKVVLGNILFPFKRTTLNILEQGAERIPILGHYVQKATRELPDPIRAQVVQQGMGFGTFAASAVIGAQFDPDSAKTVRRFVSNAGGQYSLLANLGFAVGQAIRAGKDPVTVIGDNVAYGMPLPTAEPIVDWVKAIGRVLQGHPLTNDKGEFSPPRGLVPGFVQPGGGGPEILEALGSLMAGGEESPAPTPSAAPTRTTTPAAPSGRGRARRPYVPPSERGPR